MLGEKVVENMEIYIVRDRFVRLTGIRVRESDEELGPSWSGCVEKGNRPPTMA